jgi:hypothetical protein
VASAWRFYKAEGLFTPNFCTSLETTCNLNKSVTDPSLNILKNYLHRTPWGREVGPAAAEQGHFGVEEEEGVEVGVEVGVDHTLMENDLSPRPSE